MQRLAASLLALTRVSPSQPEPDKLQRTPFDLSELVRRCIRPLNVLAQQKRQSVSVRLAGPLWAQVDVTMARQALLHVVRNAIDHCPAGSDIQIETRSEEGEALILVTDAGPGIAADDRSGAFERFERHAGGSRRRAQGGSIRLQSVPAGGCLFEFALPLIAQPRAQSARPASDSTVVPEGRHARQ